MDYTLEYKKRKNSWEGKIQFESILDYVYYTIENGEFRASFSERYKEEVLELVEYLKKIVVELDELKNNPNWEKLMIVNETKHGENNYVFECQIGDIYLDFFYDEIDFHIILPVWGKQEEKERVVCGERFFHNSFKNELWNQIKRRSKNKLRLLTITP